MLRTLSVRREKIMNEEFGIFSTFTGPNLKDDLLSAGKAKDTLSSSVSHY